ncbi:MAG: DUF116 domain-containing protein [Dehalococcoidales bacterium]|nr:DUF116 domain-containing protein [Dehalococcoidales bacterium]
MEDNLKQLYRVEPCQRILLLPHCLRRSQTCTARYDREGLQCQACNPECPVNLLRTAALESGYLGVCVAPGGRMAVQYVKEKRPRAIVAVACEKELEEGVEGVKSLARDSISPLIVVIPLLKNGCLDTEVDIEQSVEIIRTGCREIGGMQPDRELIGSVRRESLNPGPVR